MFRASLSQTLREDNIPQHEVHDQPYFNSKIQTTPIRSQLSKISKNIIFFYYCPSKVFFTIIVIRSTKNIANKNEVPIIILTRMYQEAFKIVKKYTYTSLRGKWIKKQNNKIVLLRISRHDALYKILQYKICNMLRVLKIWNVKMTLLKYCCGELSYVQAQTKKTFCNRLQHVIHIIVDLDVMIHKKTLRNSLDHKHEFSCRKRSSRTSKGS